MTLLLAGFALAIAVCLVLVARLKAANRELSRRNGEIERANRAKSRFLANMSHELRTPLNAIVGFTDLMRADGRLAPEHREFLGDIRASADHVLDLINELLDLARVEAGRITLNPTPVDPTRIAAECLETTRPLAGEREITLTLDARPMGQVLLDPARLRQVLLNYLSNAIKFTPPGGHISLSVRPEGEELAIEVIDNGPGIDEADQRRVFGEFEQIGAGGRRHPGGCGLGLAVTKRIVEAQQGVVGVRSVKGSGSTFFARLPLRPGGPAGVAPQAVPRARELAGGR